MSLLTRLRSPRRPLLPAKPRSFPMHALAAYSWCPFLSIDMYALEKPQVLDIPTHFYDLFKPQSALGFHFPAIYKIRYTIGALSEHLF